MIARSFSFYLVGLLWLISFSSVEAVFKKETQDIKPVSFLERLQNTLMPLHAQIFWPNDICIKNANNRQHLPLKEEVEGVGYFIPLHIGGAHHVWGDINLSRDFNLKHLFAGAGYRYLITRQNNREDWFWGVYGFYFPHKSPIATRLDIGLECGSLHSGQLTCDFHQFFYPTPKEKAHLLVYEVIDKKAASFKLSFRLLPAAKVLGGVNLSWIEEKTQPKRKENIFLGVEWALNPFVAAEVQTMFDIKNFQPIVRLHFKLQASGVKSDLSHWQHSLKRPPQRNNPPRYASWAEKREQAAPPWFEVFEGEHSDDEPLSGSEPCEALSESAFSDIENILPQAAVEGVSDEEGMQEDSEEDSEEDSKLKYPSGIYDAKLEINRATIKPEVLKGPEDIALLEALRSEPIKLTGSLPYEQQEKQEKEKVLVLVYEAGVCETFRKDFEHAQKKGLAYPSFPPPIKRYRTVCAIEEAI